MAKSMEYGFQVVVCFHTQVHRNSGLDHIHIRTGFRINGYLKGLVFPI